MDKVERMVSELRRAGLRITPQRLAIVRTFAHDASHPTAQDLFERLQPDFPSMSFATVYKTLDALARTGLCRAVKLEGTVSQRFDPNIDPHHHAVCESCGVVIDVPAATVAPGRTAQRRVARVAPGFAIRAVERVYRGICTACKRRKKEN